jgi:hypothetical protein
MRKAGHVVSTEEMTNAQTVLMGNPEGKKQPGRYRRRRKDNINIDRIGIEWHRDQWRALLNTVMILGSIKFWGILV